jgi:hypothetical protein
MTITSKKKTGESLPAIYAKPDEITYKTLFENYQTGANTELHILLTNDPNGFDTNGNPQYNNNVKEGNKTRQAYWLELTLYSVKVPSGYVDNTNNGEGKITFEIGWENASIRKLERPAASTP